MKITVVDSGMGGLAVAARLYEQLRRRELAAAVRFVNVRPAPGRRFEDPGTRADKLARLDEALETIEGALGLDELELLALACNSLSVLVGETRFGARHRARLLALEPLGPDDREALGREALGREVEVLVFATALTIASGAHRRALVAAGIAPERIVEQPCPGLANSIQDGHASAQTEALLARFVIAAANQRRGRGPVCVLLGCSHYAYLRQRFVAGLRARGLEVVRVLCSSDAMVGALVERARGPLEASPGRPSIALYSWAPLSAGERDNFVELIGSSSPDTAAALARVAPLERR